MMTLQEVRDEVHKICRTPGCVCLECMKCGDKWFWYEGEISRLYKAYRGGCVICGGLLKIYGYEGTDAEL